MILITGGTGFVGSHLIKRLIDEGHKVRCVIREGSKKIDRIKGLGAEIVHGDVTDADSLTDACKGIDTIVHLVGIIQEEKGMTFQSIHVDGTKNLVNAAKKNNVRLFYYQSANGADKDGKTAYYKTKAEAEEIVKSSGLDYIIFRPSLIYGNGDEFVLRLKKIIHDAPVIPIIGSGESLLQPVFIDDLVACLIKAITTPQLKNRTFCVAGPEQIRFKDVVMRIADSMGIKRPSFHIPVFFMRPAAMLMETILPKPPVTSDQITMLQMDNVCDIKEMKEAFNIEPLSFNEGLRRFLR
ncbi:MAG: complex I NDUFA9 subunit family protein [Nitrospirae bacterium]|nr:complex I NDUFA9 subunit family protein [Nitrospirota bacterium]